MHKAESAAGVTLLPVSEAAAPSRHTPARCWHPSLLREPWMDSGESTPTPGFECGGLCPPCQAWGLAHAAPWLLAGSHLHLARKKLNQRNFYPSAPVARSCSGCSWRLKLSQSCF